MNGSLESVIALVARESPDVVLMDLPMPGMSGIDATRSIVDCTPRTAILVLTMMDDDQSGFAAMRAGARGYVLKGSHVVGNTAGNICGGLRRRVVRCAAWRADHPILRQVT